MQEQVGDISLWVDGQRRDAVQGSLLQQVDAQSGLARPGPADHHRVGSQVVRIVQQRLLAGLSRLRIMNSSR